MAAYYHQNVELGHRGFAHSDAKKLGNKNVNADDILIVPSKAQSYRKTLYLFNFILAGLGLTLISMGIVMIFRSDEILMPEWLVSYFICIGLFNLLFGMIASRGAVEAKQRIERGQVNYWLMFFLVFMSALLLIELLCIGIIVIKEANWDQDQVNEGSDFLTGYLEDSLVNEFESRELFWWEIQKAWDCCGWNNNTIPDTLATGKFCTTDTDTSAPACKDDMEEYINHNKVFMIIFSTLFLLAQLSVWYSACQLGCCIQAMKPKYARS